MTTVILLVLGAIIGSFLNVLGLRWNSGLDLSGRSKCPHCRKILSWYELVPVLSFLMLRGRCLKCRSKISWQYPMIEVWTALIFATIKPVFWPVFCIYMVIVIYDLRHKIIPDNLAYTAVALSLLVRLALGSVVISLMAGLILFAFFALIFYLSGGRAMGFGDAKLSLSVGILLGLAQSLSAIVLSFWIGAVFGVAYMLLSRSSLLGEGKRITMKSEIPFAPFIIMGATVALMFHLDILHVSIF